MFKELYDKHLCPHIINFFMDDKIIKKQREKVVPKAYGRVLEIGIGSGHNLDFYDYSKVEEIYALEPHPKLIEMSQKKASQLDIKLKVLDSSAEENPLENESFDSVVCTYTLCTIPDPDKALLEVKRVLKNGGSFIFSEHGLAPEASVQKWQNRLNPLQNAIGGGCNLNRNIPLIIEKSGLKTKELDQGHIPGLTLISYNYWGFSLKE